VSPRSREREYARRRYEQWRSKQVVRLERRRRQRRQAIIAAAAVAVVLGGTGVALVVSGGSNNAQTQAAATAAPSTAASPSAASSDTGSPTSSGSPSAVAANPCPVPTVKPPAAPQSFGSAPDAKLAAGKTWKLTLTTSCGAIQADLFGAKAPKAVASAIFLSGKQFWNGSPCHRLTTSGIFVLQCGDPTGTGSGGPGYSFGPVENAPANQRYPAGTLAMARATDPNSNGSQFFIVYEDTTLPDGYTVFGKVTTGLDIVQKVAAGGSQPAGDGKPVRPISLVSTTVVPA
jgi:peptidyl-prolyl cis-trans isomerase B (cyclophilin B)